MKSDKPYIHNNSDGATPPEFSVLQFAFVTAGIIGFSLAAFLYGMKTRADLILMLHVPTYITKLVFLYGTAIGFGYIAFRLITYRVPIARSVLLAPPWMFLLMVLVTLIQLSRSFLRTEPGACDISLQCAAATLLAFLLTLLPMLWIFPKRRSRPPTILLSYLLGMCASSALALLHLHCPSDAACHDMLWHVGPVITCFIVSVVILRRVYRITG